MLVKWAGPAPTACDPTETLEILNGLKAATGSLTPHVVVKAASEPGHPLHDVFTWDDTEAAEAHRLNQARALIRSIRIVRPDAPSISYRAYAIHRLDAQDPVTGARRVYLSTEDMLADPETRLELLQRALNELKAFRKKWAGLNELAAVIDAASVLLDAK